MGKRKFKKDELRLPVYNDARRLYEQFCRSTRKLPINTKRGAIAETELWIINLLECISFADDTDGKQKADNVKEALKYAYKIMIRVRTLRNLNLLPISGFSAIVAIEDSLARQLDGWANSIENEICTSQQV